MKEEELYKVIEQTNDKTVYKFENETGDAVFAVYNIFKGVEVVYSSVHMDKCRLGINKGSNVIEIHYCKEGRMERVFQNDYFYIPEGDLSVVKTDKLDFEFEYPLNHYHGITISINLNGVSKEVYSIIDVNINPKDIVDKLCKTDGYYIVRSKQYIEHIFQELFKVPETIRKGYIRLKVLELLLVLSEMEEINNQDKKIHLNVEQVKLAKEIKKYLSENMETHIVIADIAKAFYVSESHIKNVFKGVYGLPIYQFMRVQKMQSAALKIINTNQSITDIAFEFGYNNSSKFSAAFREVIGDTPLQYRKEHTKYNKQI